MRYETWEIANTTAILIATIAPIVLAILVFLKQRQRRDASGERIGRPVLWAFVTAFASFLAFVIVWGLTLQEQYPDYATRWNAEIDQRRDVRETGTDVIGDVVGQWRPNNRNRTDYFVFTEDTWASVNPDLDSTITWEYEVLQRDGPCMRIRSTHARAIVNGRTVRDEPIRDDPFYVCVDPETDIMVMRFENSDGGDVFLVRME